MKSKLTFEKASAVFSTMQNGPWLISLTEQTENELHLTICASEAALAKKNAEPAPDTGNDRLDGILSQSTRILPDLNRKYEIVFEDYIIYQVRNESFCSFDPQEVRSGRYIFTFQKSKLLDYLYVATDACCFEDDTYYPGKWTHYAVYTTNQIVDVISHTKPTVYEFFAEL